MIKDNKGMEDEPEMPQPLKGKPNLNFKYCNGDMFWCEVGCLMIEVDGPFGCHSFDLSVYCEDSFYYSNHHSRLSLDELEEKLTLLDKFAGAWVEFDPGARG